MNQLNHGAFGGNDMRNTFIVFAKLLKAKAVAAFAGRKNQPEKKAHAPAGT